MLNTRLINEGLVNDKGFRVSKKYSMIFDAGVANRMSKTSVVADVGVVWQSKHEVLANIGATKETLVTIYFELGVLNKRYLASLNIDIGIKKTSNHPALGDVGLRKLFLFPTLIEVLIDRPTGLFILNRQRQIEAFLPGTTWYYSRRINSATDIELQVPRSTIEDNIPVGHSLHDFFHSQDRLSHAEIASFVQIYKGRKLKASGKIVGRELGQKVIINALTEETLLEDNLTPAQYGKVWDGWDLADVARDLLNRWHPIRVKDLSQWQAYMTDSQNVDLTTDPGKVMLAKRSNGTYYDSGHITLLFDKGEIPDFLRWDRIRWSADSDGSLSTEDNEPVVETSIQYSNNGTIWSSPFDGGFPEEVGLVPSDVSSDQLYVRVNLVTHDTEAEDANENKVGVTPTVFALEVVARTKGELTEGNIPELAGVTVKGLSADYGNTLSVLASACEQVGWEFNVLDGALNLAESLGADKTRDFVLRNSTNMEIQTFGDDDDNLVNVLTAYGPGQGINRLQINLKDDESIARYGIYPQSVQFEVEALADLQQKAQEYLEEHGSPRLQFEVAAIFDHEREPDYGLGDMVRVADPETGIVTKARIMAEHREFNENGLNVHLELGRSNMTLSEAISGEKAPVKPVDPTEPTGVYARGIIAGVRIGYAEPKMPNWDYSEVHLSTAKGFEPSTGTLRDRGKQTKFDINELMPGVRYYARVIHVDADGRRSTPSAEVSAVAQYMPVNVLPDYSLGVDKFMQNLKPPIMVSDKPDFPDPRYPVETLMFYTKERRLYEVVGDDWEPLEAAPLIADEIVAGIIEAGGIKADWYAEIRNTLPYTGLDSLDSENPIDYYFYIPSETEKIVSVKLSARGLPFRSYSKGAEIAQEMSSSGWTFGDVQTSSAGSHSHGIIEGWSNTGNAGEHHHTVNVSNHYHDIPAHGHDNIPGIFLGTDPANVHLYCRDSDSWGSAISLGSNTNLASELDLTSRFSGTGWKAIRFTSSRLGRITWQLVVKVDLTA